MAQVAAADAQALLLSEVSIRAQEAELPAVPAPVRKLPAQAKGLTPGAIVNLAWAFAVTGHRHDRLFGVLAKAAVPVKACFEPASLATLAWAFAAFDLHHEELMVAIAKKACRRIRHFTCEQLSQLLWAFATLRHHDAALMDRLNVGLQKQHADGKMLAPREACNLLWAVMRLLPSGRPRSTPRVPRYAATSEPGSGLQLLLPTLLQRAEDSLSAHDLVNALWALGVAAAAKPSPEMADATLRSLPSRAALASGDSPGPQAAAASVPQVWDLLPGLVRDLSAVAASSFSRGDLARLHAADLLLRHAAHTAAAAEALKHAALRSAADGTHGNLSVPGEIVHVDGREVLDVSQAGGSAASGSAVPWHENQSLSLLPRHLSEAAAAAAQEEAVQQLRRGGAPTETTSSSGWRNEVFMVSRVPIAGGVNVWW